MCLRVGIYYTSESLKIENPGEFALAEMYDTLSIDYDRFVNWENRLGFELPFLEQNLRETHSRKVLDAACGTGMHAIALAKRSYQVFGADYSEGMITKAQQNASVAGTQVSFMQAGFGDLARAFQHQLPFDSLLCLGNSLPHVLTEGELAKALEDFAACLRPGGLLIIQNRNFDAVLAEKQRWMEPQSHQSQDGEWVFVRFYEFRQDGIIDFYILTLQRQPGGGWGQTVRVTQLYPQRKAGLVRALGMAGFSQIELFGGLNGAPFNHAESGNLVILARL
jgi:glycine/sarcosine N-methyltransferase